MKQQEREVTNLQDLIVRFCQVTIVDKAKHLASEIIIEVDKAKHLADEIVEVLNKKKTKNLQQGFDLLITEFKKRYQEVKERDDIFIYNNCFGSDYKSNLLTDIIKAFAEKGVDYSLLDIYDDEFPPHIIGALIKNGYVRANKILSNEEYIFFTRRSPSAKQGYDVFQLDLLYEMVEKNESQRKILKERVCGKFKQLCSRETEVTAKSHMLLFFCILREENMDFLLQEECGKDNKQLFSKNFGIALRNALDKGYITQEKSNNLKKICKNQGTSAIIDKAAFKEGMKVQIVDDSITKSSSHTKSLHVIRLTPSTERRKPTGNSTTSSSELNRSGEESKNNIATSSSNAVIEEIERAKRLVAKNKNKQSQSKQNIRKTRAFGFVWFAGIQFVSIALSAIVMLPINLGQLGNMTPMCATAITGIICGVGGAGYCVINDKKLHGILILLADFAVVSSLSYVCHTFLAEHLLLENIATTEINLIIDLGIVLPIILCMNSFAAYKTRADSLMLPKTG